MKAKEVIDLLETYPTGKVAELGIGKPLSWRGDYYQLAFYTAKNITVGDMLINAKSALGNTFPGWKGGEYKMGEYSDCRIVEEALELGEPLTRWFFKYNLK